jgi:tetratricopeptide (TPR) repeat protein
VAASDPVAGLRDRLGRYSAERYPVQHATAQFHLGVALADRGLLEEAAGALAAAVRLFDPEGLPAEHAAAANALGAARRAQGRLDEAAACFSQARDGFDRAGRGLERAAASFNLGLVAAQRHEVDVAIACLEEAHRAFVGGGQAARAAAAAAARELGAALLAAGRLDDAHDRLAEAVHGAETAGDAAGAGGAANLLGLAHLAAGRPLDAAAAFRRSAAANPRRLRAEPYAVAKANLALAWRRAGEAPRARLAAGQALAVPAAPVPARDVAREAIGAAEPVPGALAEVLDGDDEGEWPGVVRDELDRWLDLPPASLAAEAEAWVSTVLDRPARAEALLAVWLGVTLELPPPDMDRLLAAALAALAARSGPEQEAYRRAAGRAVARFAVPQLLRVTDTLERLGRAAGIAGSWR